MALSILLNWLVRLQFYISFTFIDTYWDEQNKFPSTQIWITLRYTKGEGGGGGVEGKGFSDFFSYTIKYQHLKFSVAVRLSLKRISRQV